MGRPNHCVILVICLLIGPTLISADKKCTLGCHGSQPLFKYTEGEVYKYDLKGSSVTSVPGAKGDTASSSLEAQVEVQAGPQCTFTLKVTKATITGADGKQYNAPKEVTQYPVQFSTSGSKVFHEICANDADTKASLNIKRAIISHFQSSVLKDSGNAVFHETDFLGACSTNFNFEKEGNVLTVTKTRDLNSCAYREDLNLAFISTPYYVQSDLQSSPLLIPTYGSEQKFEDGVLKESDVTESYVYRPLATPESGAKVKVSSTLSLVSHAKGAVPDAGCTTPQTLIFDAPHISEGAVSVDSVVSAVQSVVDNTEPTVLFDGASKFNQLVTIVKQADKEILTAAWSVLKTGGGVKSPKVAQNVLRTSLFRAGSSDAISVSVSLIQSGEITPKEAEDWYLSFGFTRHVDKDALASVASVLNENSSWKAYLGIGSLANRFYREHSSQGVAEFDAILLKLAAPLKGGCVSKSNSEDNKILASLRGLGNVKHLTSEVADLVAKCFSNPQVRPKIRSVALDTFQTDAGKPELKKEAIKLLQDVNEDAELRIKAYLGLVECVCSKTAKVFKELLENEPILQVRSFISSHLRNLRSTVNPSKEGAKFLYGAIPLPDKYKYPQDLRKYSSHHEFSYLFDSLNVGASGEGNIIFSPQSFVPRGLQLNLTTQVFGQAFNLLEVDIRTENIEYLLEKYLGPRNKGQTEKKLLDKATDQSKDVYTNLKSKYQSMVKQRGTRSAEVWEEDAVEERFKRNIVDQFMDETDNENKINEDDDREESVREKRSADVDKGSFNSATDYDLDVYIKVMGSGVFWENSQGSVADYDVYAPADKAFEKLQEEYTAKQDEFSQKFDFRRQMRFLDADLLYPTSLGLTMRLTAIGGGVINLKFDGSSSKAGDVSFTALPSTSIEVVGILSVDSYVVESGLKLTSTLHSSTGTEISVKSLGTYGVELKLGVPVKKQDIVNFKTEITSVVKEPGLAYVESPIKFNVKKAEYGGCFDQLMPLIGLTPCAVVNFPFDGQKFLNPIYGPTHISLKVDKEDESLKTFLFRAYADDKAPGVKSFEILLDTPNSKTQRKIQVLGEYKTSPESKEFKGTLSSPYKDLEVQGAIVSSASQSAVSGKVLVDGVEYSAKLGAATSGSGSHRSYKPYLEYKIPELSSNSKLISKKGAKKGGQQQVSIEGEVLLDELPNPENPEKHFHQYTFKNLAIGVPSNKYVLNGNYKNGKFPDSEADLVLSYENGKQTLGLKHKFVHKFASPSDLKSDVYIEVRPSQYPDLGIALDWTSSYTKTNVSNILTVKSAKKIKFTHGNNPQSETSRISYEDKSLGVYNKDSHDFDYSHDNDVSYPLFNVNAKSSSKLSIKPEGASYLNVDITGKYEKAAFLSQLDAKVSQKKQGEYDVIFKNKFLTNSLEAELKRTIISDEKQKFSNTISFASDSAKAGNGKYSFNAEVTNSQKPESVNRRIQASLFVPQEEKPLKVDAGYKWASSELKTHLDVNHGDDPYLSSASQLVLSTSSPSGSFKLDLSDLLKSKAAFKYVAGKEYSNDFSVQLLAPKLKRKVEGKTAVSIDGEKYKGFFELLLDAEKDPSKKIRLDTETLFSWKEDSKKFATDNQFTLLEYITKFKADANVQGLIKNGKHDWSFDLSLPTELTVKGKYNGESHVKKSESDYKFALELAREGKTNEVISKLPKKLALNVKVDKIDPAKQTFNSDVDLKVDGDSGSLVDVNANVHSLVSGDKWTYGYEHKAKGSLIPENKAKYSTEQDNEYLTGEFKFAEKKSFPPMITKLEFGVNTIGEGSFELALKGKKISYAVGGKLDETYAGNSIREFKFNSDSTFDINTPKSVLETENKLQWNKDKFIKANFGVHGKEKGISINGEVETHSVPKRTFSGALSGEIPKNDAPGKIDGTLSVKWENQEAGLTVRGESFKDKTGGKLSVIANHPKTGKVEISGSNKILKDNKGVNAELSFIRNDKKVKLGLKTDLTKNKPEFDFTVDQDAGKSRVYIKYDKKDQNRFTGVVKLQWIANGGGSLDGDIDADYKSVDDFNYKLGLDSPILKLNKVKFEVNNKPSKGETQKIQYSLKNGGKILIAGNSNYVYKDEGDKKVLEGSGSFKYEDKTYPVTFKYVRKSLEKATDGETGELHKFNLVCEGMKLKYEGENKFTDEVFRVYRNFCDDGKCYVNEVSYKLKGSDVLDYEQELIVQLDFRPLMKYSELPEVHPLSLKASTKRYGLGLNQQLEIKWSPTEKIEYNVYFESTKAGVIVSLPKRTLAFESTYDLKQEKGFLGEANLWLDKSRAPEQKTSLLVKYDNSYDKNEKTLAASGEVRFSHPALPKDLSLSGRAEILKNPVTIVDANVDIDIFQKKGQKIVVDLQVNREKSETGKKVNTKFSIVSKEQNLNFVLGGYTLIDSEKLEDHTTISYVDKNNKKRDGLLHFEYSKQKFLAKVSLFDLIQWKGIEEVKLNQKDNYLEYISKHEINGNKYGEHLTIQKKGILDYVIKWKCHEKPERELGLKGEFNYKTKAEVQVTALKEGKKVEIALATVAFEQENFLKPSEAVSLDDIKEVLVTVKDDVRGFLSEQSKLGSKIGKEFAEETDYRSGEFAKAKPNLKPVLTAINSQLKEIKEEIANDKALREAAEHVKKTFNEVLETFVSLFEAFSHVFETVTNVVFDLADKLVETIKSLTPAVKDAYTKISKYSFDAIESIVKTGVTLVNSFIDELKKHEADFKGLTTFGNDVFLGVGKVVAKWYAQVQKETAEFYRVLSEQLKSLPVYPLMKEKLEELKNLQIPDNVLSVVLEVLEGLKDSLPTPELKNFADALIDYLKKVVESDQKLNVNSEELKKLSDKFIEAVKSLLAYLPGFKSVSSVDKDLIKPSSFLFPIPTLALFKYPLKLGAVHVSTIDMILNGELPFKLSTVGYTAVRGLLKPEELLPPYSATGLIVDKSNVLTYNGKWVPLAGSCSYILVKDYKNNNFSVNIKVENGKLSSIVVLDKSDEIEVSVDKKVKLNKVATEYPVRSDNAHAWRQYGKVIVLGISGVRLVCSETFDLCSVTVNGYYQNQVHGLLGSHNLEPYFDLTLPNGKPSTDKSEFYNSYAVGSCASPLKLSESTDKAAECKELFNENSTLVSGYMFVNMKPYLEACSNEVSKLATPEEKSEKACLFAAAYSTAANAAGGFWLTVPSSCLKYKTCKDQSLALTNEFKAPFSKADVVFVVEEDVKNKEVYENLVLPLVPVLKEKLSKEGFTDTHFSLIGYGSIAWPQHYTKDGELSFDPNTKITFTSNSDEKVKKLSQLKGSNSLEDRVKNLLQHVDLLGDFSLTDALREAVKYPFRPGSARAIVVVSSSSPKVKPIDSVLISYPLAISKIQGAKVVYIGPTNKLIENSKLYTPYDDSSARGTNPEQIKLLTENVATELTGKLSKQSLQVCSCYVPNDRPPVSMCVDKSIVDDPVDALLALKS